MRRSFGAGATILVVTIVLALFSVDSHGQFSPGSGFGTVILNAGSNLVGKFGFDQTTPGTTNAVSVSQIGATTTATGNGGVGGGVQRVAIASDNTAFSVNATLVGSSTVTAVPKTACGSTVASQALAAVPTSSTAVFASTTCVIVIVLNNTTASALTVTVTDNAGSPINDILTFSLPAFSQLIQPLYGVAFTTGVKWTASGAGVTGAVLGYQ